MKCRICILKFTERRAVEVKKLDVLVYFGPKLSTVHFNGRLWIGRIDISDPNNTARGWGGGGIKYEFEDVVGPVK